MQSSTFESIRLDRFVFGSTCRSIRPGLSNRTAKDLSRVLHVSYFCHAYTACFDLLEQSGGTSCKICVPLIR